MLVLVPAFIRMSFLVVLTEKHLSLEKLRLTSDSTSIDSRYASGCECLVATLLRGGRTAIGFGVVSIIV
jgi:hypothetical protein